VQFPPDKIPVPFFATLNGLRLIQNQSQFLLSSQNYLLYKNTK
jgi:hypothetical protein